MKSWTSFSASFALLLLAGCAPRIAAVPPADAGVVAVFPPENLSGRPAPLKEISRGLARRLADAGMKVWGEKELEAFMAGHRIRYTGGIDAETSRELRKAGVAAVLVTDVELSTDNLPWKTALSARLVETGDTPAIRAAAGAALSGADAPGFLGMGLAKGAGEVTERALDRVASSLTETLAGRDGGRGVRSIPPQQSFRSPVFDPSRTYTVAVLPFVNHTDRTYAGEIMALHFVRELGRYPNIRVLEPGVVRQELLRFRVIMEEGVSLVSASVFFDHLQVDLVVGGEVNDFEDFIGATGDPVVDFSAYALENRSRESVWTARSFRRGDDGVYFYNLGRINTAPEIADDLVRGAAATLVSPQPE